MATATVSLVVPLTSSADAARGWRSSAAEVGVVAQDDAPAVLPGLDDAAATPVQAAVNAAISGPLSQPALGGASGLVIDATTGQLLWSSSPNTAIAPASLTKILTAAAALATLGPQDSPTTALLTTGAVRGGVLGGDLYLRGSGDVLLSASGSAAWPARAGLDQLVAGLRAAGVTAIHGRLIGDGSLFTGPMTADSWVRSDVTAGSVAPVTALGVDEAGAAVGRGNRSGDPRQDAVAALRTALTRAGITVTGYSAVGTTPVASRVVASVAGTPVRAAVAEMLENSDNDVAESLGRRVAIKLGYPATFAGAASAIRSAIAGLGISVTGLSLYDASGLSHDDRVAPATITAVLRLAAAPTSTGGRPALRPIIDGLSVAAFDGTLAPRYRIGDSLPGAGIVRAKTGSLSGVSSLGGSVVTQAGRQLLFVWVSDGVRSRAAAEAALDQAASALAGL
jgi:D-alanyl-D-alanine carboxypeptidase/D-alanyl-D-alanine-endopeptidase (penicillin-binding protein 4)